jgi:hypothetical protein
MIIHLPLFDKKDTSFDAITLCFVIIVFVKNPSVKLLKHELTHSKQWKEDPFLFHFKYLLEFIVNLTACGNWMDAYRSISYEKEARGEAK